MIKFFRKIRQKLISENKITRYLLYAVGEIVLVVIGILIALAVNQRSQNQANEEKVATILEAILKDLSADITESDQILNTIHVIDSFSFPILSNPKSLHNQDNVDIEIDILRFSNLFNFTNGGYQNLSHNLDIVPKKYDSILNKLHHHYNAYKESVQYWDNKVNRLTNENERFLIDTFDWYHNPTSYAKHKNELRNNTTYRNKLFHFREVNKAWLYAVNRYKGSCINLYQTIASVLEKPLVDDSFKVDESVVNLFLGKWKETTKGNLPDVTFLNKKGRLFLEFPDASKIEFNILSTKINDSIKEVTINERNRFYYHKFKKDTLILTQNNSETNKVDVFKYVKVN